MKTFILLAATLVIGASYALNLDKAQPPESRIVNGIEASTTDMPYQVGLFVRGYTPTTGSRCGGALISETVVLTAAHCFTNTKTEGWAYLGTNRYQQGRFISYTRVTIHEKYNSISQVNDIALVHLDAAVQPNGFTIKFIQLDRNPLADNTPVTVSGYGLIAEGVGTDKLFYTQMTTNKNECDKYWALIDSQVCAKGVDGRETCAGDSGGPVVRNWPNNPTHVALVSFGAGCQKDRPKVFTRTASYIDWIEKNM